MAFLKKPATGMRDILPGEKAIRERVKNTIRQTYLSYGFTEIETPIAEHLENLNSNKGGENEKLIFKILKRGDKLKRAIKSLSKGTNSSKGLTRSDCGGEISQAAKAAGTGESPAHSEISTENISGGEVSPEYDNDAKYVDLLCEEGLRYDLTVPLCRYFAANYPVLSTPFKAIQMGPVFRADRPQKGRFRQFTQCDIDILGDETTLAEKELILATTDALDKIGFSKYNFYIAINDRRLLLELIKYAGFKAEDAPEILITLDKMDKIGKEGVIGELDREGFRGESVKKIVSLLSNYENSPEGARNFSARINTREAILAGESLTDIMHFVSSIKERNIRIEFDPTLVRGMGYYTGTIFEIKTDAFGSSVGGGGRYDKMVGEFTGKDVPAVGFSIGFERIMDLIMQEETHSENIISKNEKSAWLIEKSMPEEKLNQIFKEALAKRTDGKEVLMVWMAKNKKFQMEKLKSEGFLDIKSFYIEELKNK